MELINNFVPYNEALALKELGFDEPCFATYSGEVLELSIQIPSDDYFTQAPLYQQAFRFFREKYGAVKICIEQCGIKADKKFIFSIIYLNEYVICENSKTTFSSYEEAELECLRYLIKTAKEQ